MQYYVYMHCVCIVHTHTHVWSYDGARYWYRAQHICVRWTPRSFCARSCRYEETTHSIMCNNRAPFDSNGVLQLNSLLAGRNNNSRGVQFACTYMSLWNMAFHSRFYHDIHGIQCITIGPEYCHAYGWATYLQVNFDVILNGKYVDDRPDRWVVGWAVITIHPNGGILITAGCDIESRLGNRMNWNGIK